MREFKRKDEYINKQIKEIKWYCENAPDDYPSWNRLIVFEDEITEIFWGGYSYYKNENDAISELSQDSYRQYEDLIEWGDLPSFVKPPMIIDSDEELSKNLNGFYNYFIFFKEEEKILNEYKNNLVETSYLDIEKNIKLLKFEFDSESTGMIIGFHIIEDKKSIGYLLIEKYPLQFDEYDDDTFEKIKKEQKFADFSGKFCEVLYYTLPDYLKIDIGCRGAILYLENGNKYSVANSKYPDEYNDFFESKLVEFFSNFDFSDW